MAESDLDKDLAGLMNDIGGSDSADAGGGGIDLDADLAGIGGSDAAPAEGGGAGGDEMSLDPDLANMMNDASSGGGGGEDMSMDIGGSGGGGAMASMGGSAPATGGGHVGPNLDFLLDIKLNVTFEVGRAKMLISDLLTLGQGSVIELHRLVGDELDLLVNGKLVAKGEVVVINEKFGCKISNIIPPEDRIRHMGGF